LIFVTAVISLNGRAMHFSSYCMMLSRSLIASTFVRCPIILKSIWGKNLSFII